MTGKRPFLLTPALIVAALWLDIAATAAAAAEPPVAMVTEATGKGEVMRSGSASGLRLLTELETNAQVTLQKDARAVVLYLQSGDQYALAGPGVFVIGLERPLAEKQAAGPIKLGPVTGKNGKPLQIRNASLSQAGIVMRTAGKRPIPAKRPTGAVTLSTPAVFEWEAIGAGIDYEFVLKDEKGNTVFAQVAPENQVHLPAEISLDPGAVYRWSVSARGADGARYLSVYRFSVADLATKAAFDNFYPQGSATIAERVAFAAWLESYGLADEMAQYRQELNKRYGLAESSLK